MENRMDTVNHMPVPVSEGGAEVSTWREKYRQDPDLAESIITTLRSDLDEAEVRVKKLEYALEQIRDGNWKPTLATPSLDYWMQQIAREALE